MVKIWRLALWLMDNFNLILHESSNALTSMLIKLYMFHSFVLQTATVLYIISYWVPSSFWSLGDDDEFTWIYSMHHCLFRVDIGISLRPVKFSMAFLKFAWTLEICCLWDYENVLSLVSFILFTFIFILFWFVVLKNETTFKM